MPVNSILNTIKGMLGVNENETAFDTEITTFINTAFNHLFEIGIGQDAFVVTGQNQEWSDFASDIDKYEPLKTYVYIKVKLLFDPPSSSFVLDAMNKQLSEIEFRLLSKKEVEDYNNQIGGEIQNGV